MFKDTLPKQRNMYIVINTKDTPLSEIKQELIEHLKILIQDKKNFSNKHKIKNALVKFELFDKKENKKHGIIPDFRDKTHKYYKMSKICF